jgi:hypothetical protein
MNKNILVALLFMGSFYASFAQTRETLPIMDGWKLWQDKSATWENDSLYLPENVVISELAKTAPIPTGGWATLNGSPEDAVDVKLPAIVEEYFTLDGKIDTWLPGVFWFWKEVAIPASWSGKSIRLNLESYRLRAEIFVNEQLTGYDIIGNTPYNCDISDALQYGKTNRIAIRITSPRGNGRWWGDTPMIPWGKYQFPPSRDFGGINGQVKLVATDKTAIEDIYIKNLNTPDYKSIEVQTDIRNERNSEVQAQITYEIVPVAGGKPLYTATENIRIPHTKSLVVTKQIHCPDAKLWDIETPNLYECRISLTGKAKDADSRKFGFRVFEVGQKSGNSQAHYYINGKRMIFKSGIDFSYYAYTGAYPTEEMARKGVLAAKQLGQNAFNFHRYIGFPIVLDKADEAGLFLYEEMGGFHSAAGEPVMDVPSDAFAAAVTKEKMRRMVVRDRNHPSLIMYNLSNEDDQWNDFRQMLMEQTHRLDEARLVVNTSGGTNGGKARAIQHLRPYENTIRTDFTDDHTVGAETYFEEKDFNRHIPVGDSANILYWGEVKCYVGPDNWNEIATMFDQLKTDKPAAYKGYNYSYYLDFSRKIKAFFEAHKMAKTGSGIIRTPGDISKTAGAGKMYKDGRNAQNIMSYDRADGYAINAWSGGNGMEGFEGWHSGMVDDGRNIKGDPAIYAYYTRPLQIVIQRKTTENEAGGKFFEVSGKPAFKIKLINQGILPAGDYVLVLKLKDGAGKYHAQYENTLPVKVIGGDVYAQDINDNYVITLNNTLQGGFITLEGTLYDSRVYDGHKRKVTDGAEQILLANRPGFASQLQGKTYEVCGWPAAGTALENAKANVKDFSPIGKANYILAAGNISSETLDAILAKVKKGTNLIIRFDSLWAEALADKKILSERVTEWGAPQTGFWNGNGFGYIDYSLNNGGLPGQQIVPTTSWEVSGEPTGFYPFKSKYKTSVQGVYVARPDVLRVLMGAIDYGKGKIILAPSYPVDDNHPFNDLIFYNLLSLKIK